MSRKDHAEYLIYCKEREKEWKKHEMEVLHTHPQSVPPPVVPRNGTQQKGGSTSDEAELEKKMESKQLNNAEESKSRRTNHISGRWHSQVID